MIHISLINADGTYDLNDGKPTTESEGSVIIFNPNVAHGYTIGCKDRDDTFVGYPDGLVTESKHVLHGKGARLQIQVTGTSPGDDLEIGYSG